MNLPVFLLAATLPALAAAQTSSWVYFGPDHRLHYKADPRGNRIMDFSHAGYMGGGVKLPDVPAAKTLSPIAGDNTAQIQAAIDAVSKLEPDRDGFRGAVLLGAGSYDVAGSLIISNSGVVLRGSGSEDGGTTLRLRGRPHRLLQIRGAGSWQTVGDAVPIANAYVPSGSTTFDLQVTNTAKLKAGDTILVQRPVTETWVQFMEMDHLERNGQKQTWIRPGHSINTDRTIQSIDGYRVTLDVPLTDSFDARHLNPSGATIVKYQFPGRIRQVGFEHVRVDATPEPGTTGEHSLLGMSAVSDAWVRDVAVVETRDAMSIGGTARRITVDRLRFRHRQSTPHMGGSSPADIAVSGTQVLIDRCSFIGKQFWPVVTQGEVTGPIVLLNLSADEAGFSPHQRWATGLLVDGGEFRNNWERRPGIALANRHNAGSGHGWSAGWSVAWNVKSDYLLVQQPPGGMNWCIGATARFTTVSWDGSALPVLCEPADAIESMSVRVEPASLYLEQLRQRLGQTAVENIGY